MTSDIAVVGSGVAGVSAVQSLRSQGYDGRLFLIGKESRLPYDRTALSKAFLTEDMAHPPPLLSTDCYHELEIEMVLDKSVLRLDVSRRELLMDGGVSLRASA